MHNPIRRTQNWYGTAVIYKNLLDVMSSSYIMYVK